MRPVGDPMTVAPPDPVVAAAPSSVAATRLQILPQLFQRLDHEQIRYCHWKSTEHLGATMTGATDVDVLVERSGAQRLTHLLTQGTTFKRFVVKAGRGYPGIEDYVGFDAATGKLSHLHVHYQLTLGEKFLKGHRLPWEDVVLDTRVRDEASGLWVTEPHLELLILIARHVMKLRLRDTLLAAVGHDADIEVRLGRPSLERPHDLALPDGSRSDGVQSAEQAARVASDLRPVGHEAEREVGAVRPSDAGR